MKKFALFVLLTLLMASCVTQKHVYKSFSHIIDYSRYDANGFFITESPSVNFDYTPIGKVIVELSSGYETTQTISKVTGKILNEYGNLRTVTVYDALDELQKKCKEAGANGIINLKIHYDEVALQTIVSYGSQTVSKTGAQYMITGMAIKR